jgi:hypothetical protein
MKGDFTRNTHNPDKHFLRVLMQQGRVQLDADWNEQVFILLGYIQTLATDLIGPYGGPKNNCGFEIFPATSETLQKLSELTDKNKIERENKIELETQIGSLKDEEKINFLIGIGHYYVHGKLCHSQKYELYSRQKYYPFGNENKLEVKRKYLVYLDVWERHISYIEDESELTPRIREVALGKADTTTRSQLVWQVKTIQINGSDFSSDEDKNRLKSSPEVLRTFLKDKVILKPGTGLLKAQAKMPAGADASQPCTIAPDSRYRGAENQLYRIEIHHSGNADKATFKWSRENGSVIFPVQEVDGKTITLGHLGWDDRSSLKPDDWVELIDDQYELQGRAESLRQVASIKSMEMTVELKDAFSPSINEQSHRLLRRWDQKENSKIKLDTEGTIMVKEEEWIPLEEGVEIYFDKSDPPTSSYTTGDYWLIPARTATGDVEWPQETTGGNLSPIAILPHGVEHQYAPLWIISVDGQGSVTVNNNDDCRCQFPNLCEISDLFQLKTP